MSFRWRTGGGACRGPGRGGGGEKGWVEPKARRFLRRPSPAACPSSPLVQGHDGHAWRRCHPEWRGPRALPTLQSELRSYGQGGWALHPALGTRCRLWGSPLPALFALRPRPSPPKTLSGCVCVGLIPSPQAAGSPRIRKEGRDRALGPCQRPGIWAGSVGEGRGRSEEASASPPRGPQPHFLLPHSGQYEPQESHASR